MLDNFLGSHLIELFSSLLNCVSIFGNFYWQAKYKSVQVKEDLIRSLNDENNAKDVVIKQQQKEIHRLKLECQTWQSHHSRLANH